MLKFFVGETVRERVSPIRVLYEAGTVRICAAELMESKLINAKNNKKRFVTKYLTSAAVRSFIQINGFAYAPFGTLAFSDKVVHCQKYSGNADIHRRHI
jgi:hypothetical protein